MSEPVAASSSERFWSQAALAVGTKVDVRRRFDGSWTAGFEVAEALPNAYRLRRVSDGTVLPSEFGLEDVREGRGPAVPWV